MEQIEIKSKPELQSGLEYINIFMFGVRNIKLADQVTIEKIFQKIFQDQTPHLVSKYSYENLAGFFLNLDTSNQIKFLIGIGFGSELLKMPSIEKWIEYGIELGMNDWDDGYTEEDVRSCGVMFLSEWDLFPHVLTWIGRFLLFTNNNGIDDISYSGEKFGNYPNWEKYLKHLPINEKQNFVKLLINYK